MSVTKLGQIRDMNREMGRLTLQRALLKLGHPAVIDPDALVVLLSHPHVRVSTITVEGMTVQRIHLVAP